MWSSCHHFTPCSYQNQEWTVELHTSALHFEIVGLSWLYPNPWIQNQWERKSYIDVAKHSCTRSIGDGTRNFESRPRDEVDTRTGSPSPDYHTRPTKASIGWWLCTNVFLRKVTLGSSRATRLALGSDSDFFPFPVSYLVFKDNLVALHFKYDQARRRFVEWAQNEIAVVPDFHKRILFSDEAHFWLNGYVNKQNCRIWSEANPQVYVETPLHPEKLTVWCALWAGGIIGPYFFKNDQGHNVIVNGDRYRAMITNFFIPELNNQDVQELWFQQDGATCHTARATIDLLKDTFGDRLISRFGPVNWPPRSCDLTPLDYFRWGYVIPLVYADKSQTLDHLEDNIRRVFADIRPQMLEKSSKIGRPDWTTSEPAMAVLCQKSYLKCNATRLSFE
ncbi:uncharacterized protein TNCV_1744051 [Trichonephila clavipes]|nr:uncharacterized protein TNCV_1744051 [Trichonephila clavipes]